MSDTPQSGWYPDPTGRHENRWWDGNDWTDQVADGQTVSVDPVHGGPPATAAGTPAAAETPAVDPGATQAIPQPVPSTTFPVSPVPVGGPPPGAPPGADYVGPGAAKGGGGGKTLGILAVVLIVIAVAVGIVFALGGGDDSGSDQASNNQSDEADQSDANDEPSASDLFDDMASDSTDSADDPFGTDDTTPTEDTTAPTGGEAYPQPVIDNFVNACVGGGASSTVCQCTINVLQRDVSYERFVEIDQQLGANPDVIPQELTDAVNECR
jgi:Protein of unknown function (DUF2510)